MKGGEYELKEQVLLGIDAGTGSVKTSLFTAEGKLLRESAFAVALSCPENDRAEIDAEALFARLLRAIGEIAAGFEDQLAAIGLSVTSPTLVLLDRERNAVRPGIVYLDNRGVKEVEQGVERFGGGNMYFARVGNHPSPSTCAAATINWIRAHEPTHWNATARVGFLNTFLAAKLTGNVAADPTIASYSGLVRVRNPYVWEKEFLEIFDIDGGYLPEILPSFGKAGGLRQEIADRLGLPSGIPVAIGGADTAVTSFALGVHKHGDIVQSMGTSEVITFCLNAPNFSPAFMNRGHVVPGLWLSNGAMSTAGGSIQWMLKNIFPELSSEEELERLARGAPRGANGLVFLPYLCGERSPIFDTRASGVFFGLNLNTRKADLMRAVYEGVAYGMQQIYKIGTERWNVSPSFVKCVGGASKSALAVQLRADALNTQIRTIESRSAASYGAAMLGAMAADIYGQAEDVPCVEGRGRIVDPEAESARFFKRHGEVYRGLYPNLRELMRVQYDYAMERP